MDISFKSARPVEQPGSVASNDGTIFSISSSGMQPVQRPTGGVHSSTSKHLHRQGALDGNAKQQVPKKQPNSTKYARNQRPGEKLTTSPAIAAPFWLATWVARLRRNHLAVRAPDTVSIGEAPSVTANSRCYSDTVPVSPYVSTCSTSHLIAHESPLVSYPTHNRLHAPPMRQHLPLDQLAPQDGPMVSELFLQIRRGSLSGCTSLGIAPSPLVDHFQEELFCGSNSGSNIAHVALSNQSKVGFPPDWYANELATGPTVSPQCLPHYRLPTATIDSPTGRPWDSRKQCHQIEPSVNVPPSSSNNNLPDRQVEVTRTSGDRSTEVPSGVSGSKSTWSSDSSDSQEQRPVERAPFVMSQYIKSPNRYQSSRIRFQGDAVQVYTDGDTGSGYFEPTASARLLESSSSLSTSLPSFMSKRPTPSSPTITEHPLHFTVDFSNCNQQSTSGQQRKAVDLSQRQVSTANVSQCSVSLQGLLRARPLTANAACPEVASPESSTSEAKSPQIGRPFLLATCTGRQRSACDVRFRKYQFLINNFLERPSGRRAVLYHLSQ